MKILDTNIKLGKPKSLLFDWDNTLVDSLKVIRLAMEETFKAFKLTPLTKKEFLKSTHISSRMFIKNHFPEEDQVRAREVFLDLYIKFAGRNLRLLPHAKEALEAVHNKKIKMALVSNKAKFLLSTELKQSGLDKYFLSIVGSGDLKEDKPSPLPALKALEELGIEPSQEVWLIGDSATDMSTAHNANCMPVFFGGDDYTSEQYKSCPPKIHFSSHKALIKYISSLDE
jgi:phosphoglycolate phosphatase